MILAIWLLFVAFSGEALPGCFAVQVFRDGGASSSLLVCSLFADPAAGWVFGRCEIQSGLEADAALVGPHRVIFSQGFIPVDLLFSFGILCAALSREARGNHCVC
ncbi:hypothetical protein AC482_00505 [miscellaneous Crenarchaeota group-15 archaeon DG-45]|uniref:Uncharacterized protein n=1 Tax=miscellaneous Crenarchaeota group-15 archaeon DG-45 TaxID=1685127 RepID=A0A0M0BT37_9ARCH|nr:MAG: hypothetical protein AC482_00505 [miscellaneous Crenarchaeota group-15 archaeon DG-45]